MLRAHTFLKQRSNEAGRGEWVESADLGEMGECNCVLCKYYVWEWEAGKGEQGAKYDDSGQGEVELGGGIRKEQRGTLSVP